MPALVHYIKDVTPGFGDYFTDTHEISQLGEYIDMEFNDDFTLEDLILETEDDLTDGDSFEIQLVYPQSGRVGIISSIQAVVSPTGPLQFFLNSVDYDTNVVDSGHLGTGKQWYRIAPRTILRVLVVEKASDPLRIRFNAIGHSGHTG